MTNLACTDCSKEIFGNDEFNYFLDLTKNKSTQKHYKQNENLTILLKNLETHISTSHKRNCNETSRDLNLDQNPNILFLKSDIGMKVSLSEAIDFMGYKSLECKAVITTTDSYFRFNDQWYQVGNETNTILENLDVLSDVRMVSYKAIDDYTWAEEYLYFLHKLEMVYQNADYMKKLGILVIDTRKLKKEAKIIGIK